MRPRFVSPNRKHIRVRPAHLAIAALAALITAGDQADAASRRSIRPVESITSRTAGEPVLAIVSLRNQEITVYDANGWIQRAPVSSGQKGRETPAGVFSVIQKEAEHYSNLYDDAYMPHMQRITWSGIALHGGPLPGYASSHGCIRMPFAFAARLFDLTQVGMRVVVAPRDVAPVEIAHPALSRSKSAGAFAAARAAEADAAARKADEAARKADEASLAAATASREAMRATISVRVVENLKLGAEAQLAAAQTALGTADSAEAKERAANAKAKAVARIADLQAQLAVANAAVQTKLDAVAPARDAAVAAETARVATAESAREAAQELEPVSVFISRKTQRLYVRRAFQPILESQVKIVDPDRPTGTHVFTAMERINGDTDMRWSVVSLDVAGPKGGVVKPHGRTRGGRGRDVEPPSTDQGGASAALDRIVIPQDVLDRLVGMALPRSSLIISDEVLSSETSKGTDFVVVLSGEPQGGIKFRRRGPGTEVRYERTRNRVPHSRSPLAGPSSVW